MAVASFTPRVLASSSRSYWRVDELLGTNATAGATWTFATAVNAADAPLPAQRFYRVVLFSP